MNIALRELRRRPGQFAPALVAVTLLVVLLVVLGGFLDGLERSQTGVIRAHEGQLLVMSEDSELAPRRSRLPGSAADALRQLDGVDSVGAVSQVATTAGRGEDIIDVVLVGYEQAAGQVPAPPSPGSAVVDTRLAEQLGVETGDELEVGPGAAPVTITATVGDVSAGAPTVWVAFDAWRELAQAADPTSGATVQILAVTGGATAADLEAAVDGATAATVDQVIAADDVVTQQSSTFQGILGVTFVVTLLVVVLFFVLLTIERVRLYAVLKAVGGRSRDLLGGLAIQAVGIAVAAVAVGMALSVLLLSFVPPDLPIVLVPSRLAVLAVATVVTALVGALGTLRRILRIDPADAIG